MSNKRDVAYYYCERVKVQNWRGEWDEGKVIHVYEDGTYEVECCGLHARVKPSDLRKVKERRVIG